MKYVLAFVFSPDFQRVVMIKKNRPANLAGRINALGGKIEGLEFAADAMAREVKEECGISVPAEDFLHIGKMTDDKNDFVIHVGTAVANIDTATTTTDEVVMVLGVNSLIKMSTEGGNEFDLDMLYWLQLAKLAHISQHRRYTHVKFQ